jgi:hypothetical protein
MLVTLELAYYLIGFASGAYRRYAATRDTDVLRLDWCCGCVSTAEHVAGLKVWSDEIRCPVHARDPLRTVTPPVGGSHGLFG